MNRLPTLNRSTKFTSPEVGLLQSQKSLRGWTPETPIISDKPLKIQTIINAKGLRYLNENDLCYVAEKGIISEQVIEAELALANSVKGIIPGEWMNLILGGTKISSPRKPLVRKSPSEVAEEACGSINDRIKRAEDLPAKEAIEEIRTLWNAAEKTCELAAATAGIVLLKLPFIELEKTPGWFIDAKKEWSRSDKNIYNRFSMAAAERICQAVHKQFPSLSGRVEVGMLGRITINWIDESEACLWMIDPTDLPFPSVKIYEVTRNNRGKYSTRTINDMHDAFKSLVSLAGAITDE